MLFDHQHIFKRLEAAPVVRPEDFKGALAALPPPSSWPGEGGRAGGAGAARVNFRKAVMVQGACMGRTFSNECTARGTAALFAPDNFRSCLTLAGGNMWIVWAFVLAGALPSRGGG